MRPDTHNNQILSRPLLAAILFIACTNVLPQALHVDDVIDRFVDAIGGRDRIGAVDNLAYSKGQYEEDDFRSNGNSTMSLGRPWFKLVGDKNSPGGYMEGYDGAAWEWFANPGVVIRTVGAASAAGRHYAGVEHPLVDYREKGSTVQLLGESEFDGRPVHVIRLARRDGFVEQFYIDHETFLINASGGAAPIHAFGKDVARITRIADYRDVGGVLIAHRFEAAEVPSGRTLSSMQWGSIEANRPLPDDWFSPPDFERAPLQHFIESLYGQRADPDAVRWTYDEFVRAYPNIDTSEAVNFAGYQVLKMGDVDVALTLLEQNVRDYPDSSSARFELGRAFGTAGNPRAARDEYRKALEIDPENKNAAKALDAL